MVADAPPAADRFSFHCPQVLDVTGFLKYAVQAAAMFETRFNSVERLMAYFDLPQEAPRLIEATKCATAFALHAWLLHTRSHSKLHLDGFLTLLTARPHS